jgi:hypothetical protein
MALLQAIAVITLFGLVVGAVGLYFALRERRESNRRATKASGA